jgi:hypothetical protein
VTSGVARRALVLPLVAAAAGVLLVVGWHCPIRALVGAPCPTCGMTRALRHALHGDFAGATRWHPLVWIVVPFVAAWLAIELVGFVRTGAWGASARIPHATRALVVVATLIFAVWIARFFGAFGGPAPPG